MTYVTKDSGARDQFDTGAQRDQQEGRGMPALISPMALRRLAQLMERGAVKYDARNWEKGFPFSRVANSLFRHLLDYMEGDRTEDHLAAIMFNAQALIHQEEMIQRGLMDAGLYDMPDYLGQGRDPVRRALNDRTATPKPLNIVIQTDMAQARREYIPDFTP